jgi:DNA primase
VRIRREDVERVRNDSRIDDVVGEHVALKPAGIGSLKGLCPFHDERSPSFHVRPAVNLYHCFGCGEGGDVISFVQKIDHLTFTEAVERLAARMGFQLRYEDDGSGKGGGKNRGETVGRRQRLLEANRAAAQFYEEQLDAGGNDAMVGQRFILDRGFDRAAAAHFGVGFAPRGGEVLLRHLRGRGYTEEELLASGLAGQGRRGLYDRFRGRLLWPIRDVTGDVVGFGARRIFDDDSIEAKYLNTPETAIYHKSQVLYGVDLAKRDIARGHEAVVVEGYTDVMACHLAGVTTAVATCGTSFGTDHIRIVRRLIGDDASAGGRVVFTFDGDAAGQKAALRAFEEDQRFVAQTFIAVAREGMDPCDLRLKHGDEAVRELVASRTPLFEFAIRTLIDKSDLDTAEGRVRALRAAAPVVARIRDPSLRPEYARMLAGWLGMEVEPVRQAVNTAVKNPDQGRREHSTSESTAQSAQSARPAQPVTRIDTRDPAVRTEQQVLASILQVPRLLPAAELDSLSARAFRVPAYQQVFEAVQAEGGLGVAVGLTTAEWVSEVERSVPPPLAPLVTELAVTPLDVDSEAMLPHYAVGMALALVLGDVNRRRADLHSRLQRAELDEGRRIMAELLTIEQELVELRGRIHAAQREG